MAQADVEVGCERPEVDAISLDNDDTGCCAVCLEAYDSEASSTMNYLCGHVFHIECTREWVCTQFKSNVDLTCPICRFVQCHVRSPYYRRLKREMGITTETTAFTVAVSGGGSDVEQAHNVYIQQARHQQQRFIQNQRGHSQCAHQVLGFVLCGVMVLLIVFVIIVFKAMVKNE